MKLLAEETDPATHPAPVEDESPLEGTYLAGPHHEGAEVHLGNEPIASDEALELDEAVQEEDSLAPVVLSAGVMMLANAAAGVASGMGRPLLRSKASFERSVQAASFL